MKSRYTVETVLILLLAIVLLALCTVRDSEAQISGRCAQYQRLVTNIAWSYGIEGISMLGGQIMQESACNPKAASKYARGLAQFTPPTESDMRRWYPILRDWVIWDAEGSIRAMVLYDRRLYGLAEQRFEPGCEAWAATLAGYNGGWGHILRDKALCIRARDENGKDCDPSRWFGHVENYTARADWARKENRHYPRAILHKWQPKFIEAGWNGVSVCVP